MLLVDNRAWVLNRLDVVVLLKASIVSFFALYFLFEIGLWQTILAPQVFYKKAFVLLGFSALYFSVYHLRNKFDLKKLIFLICFLDVFFVGSYALYSPMPLNLFVGILSLNILVAGFNLSKSRLALIASLSVLVFTLFLNQRNLLDVNYSFVYFLLNSLSFILYAVAAFYLQAFFAKNSSEVKMLSKHLMKQRELNKTILSSIDSSVFITGFDGIPIAINKAAQDLNSEVDLSEALQDLSKKLLIKPNFVEEVQLDGRIYKVYGSSLESDLSVEDTRQNVLLVNDETGFVKTQKDLEQSRKLAAIGTLSAGLAHEIRNPLAGISGSVELIKEGSIDAEDQKRLFGTVLKEIDRLNSLVTDFLSFAQPEVKLDDQIEISSLLDEIIFILKTDSRSKGIEINVDCEQAELLVDQNKLKQVLINLIINAFQAFSRESIDSEKSCEVSLKGVLLDEGYSLKVEDNGKGIPKSELNMIFEPFHTTKDKGTGLGLALSHRILDGHGAGLSVESELGKGTVFTILFKK